MASSNKRDVPAVLLLSGDPSLVRVRALRLQEKLLGDASDFGTLEQLHGDTATPETLATAILTLGLFACRLVVVRAAERLKDEAQKCLLDLLDQVPDQTRVLLLAESADMRRSLFSQLNKRGWVEELTPPSAEQSVRTTAKSLGLSLSSEVEQAVAAYIGADPERISSELEKLFLRYGENPISLEQAIASMGGERALAQFALVNHLRERRVDAVLAALRQTLREGERIYVVIGQIAHEVRSLLRARALLASGLNEAAAIRAFGGWAGKYAVAGARNYSGAELREGLRGLARVDMAVKTGTGEPVAKLEQMLLRLCARPQTAAQSAGGRRAR